MTATLRTVLVVMGSIFVSLALGSPTPFAKAADFYDLCLKVDHIEVTQGIQRDPCEQAGVIGGCGHPDASSLVPLVDERSTAVRVYFTPDWSRSFTCGGGQGARMEVLEGANLLHWSSYAGPIWMWGPPWDREDERYSVNASFLPIRTSQTADPRTITFKVCMRRAPLLPPAFPGDVPPEGPPCNDPETDYVETRQFAPRQQLAIAGVPINYTYSEPGPPQPPGPPDAGAIEEGNADREYWAIWPVPDAGMGGYVVKGEYELPWPYCVKPGRVGDGACPGEPVPTKFGYGKGSSRSDVLLAVLEDINCAQKWKNRYPPGYPSPLRAGFVFGWLPDGARGGGVQSGHSAFADASPDDEARSRANFAHELGHYYIDYNGGVTHRNGTIGEVGWDVLSRLADTFGESPVRRRYTDEIMRDSFGMDPRTWAPPDHYQRAFNNVGAYAGMKCGRRIAEGDLFPETPFYFIHGTVFADPARAARLRMPIELTDGIDLSPSASGSGQLKTFDDQGAELYATSFEVAAGQDTTFALPIPASPDVHSITLYVSGAAQDTITRTTHAPELTITSPVPGQVLTETLTVRWAASDADGDSLLATVLYISGAGERHDPIATRFEGTELTRATTDLPATSGATIQVRVSDGLNTTVADVPHLTLGPNRVPRVTVVSPMEGGHYGWGANAVFLASAFDPEDGWLGDGAVAWYSNVDGFLGNGLAVNTALLSAGAHAITFQAADSGGAVTSATVNIMVE